MDSWGFIAILNTIVLYIGILFASGTLFYHIIFETHLAKQAFSSRRTILIFAWLGLCSSFISYALKAVSLTGELRSAFDSEMLSILWQTPIGTFFAWQITGLVLLILSLFLDKKLIALGVIGSVIALASFTQIGHTTGNSTFLLKLLLLAHLVGISLWLGILLPLFKLCGQVQYLETTAIIAKKFGTIASVVVPVLISCGIILSVQLVGSFNNLFTTNYGQSLLWKIIFVTCVLCLAVLNKAKFAPKLNASKPQSLRMLRLSVLVESIFILSALSITSIITNLHSAPSL